MNAEASGGAEYELGGDLSSYVKVKQEIGKFNDIKFSLKR